MELWNVVNVRSQMSGKFGKPERHVCITGKAGSLDMCLMIIPSVGSRLMAIRRIVGELYISQVIFMWRSSCWCICASNCAVAADGDDEAGSKAVGSTVSKGTGTTSFRAVKGCTRKSEKGLSTSGGPSAAGLWWRSTLSSNVWAPAGQSDAGVP